MSRKRQDIPNALVDLFWTRVDKLLLSKGGRLYLQNRVPRNKNTYTNWFSSPRPDPSLADVGEICAALSISPAEILRSTEELEAVQLELPFVKEGDAAQIEVQWTGVSVVIRKPPTLEKRLSPDVKSSNA